MKKKILKINIVVLLMAASITSCSLDEYNPSTIGLETAYKYREGYEGLINSCYVDLYFLYGKLDGIAPMEMGTDLWTNVGGSQSEYILYDENFNTSVGTLNVLWQSLYSVVNLSNTAIYYADDVEGFSGEELDAKVAEAYFLRAWANFHLVEQFGNVVLRKESMIQTGAESNPQRSSEESFYDLILSDLDFACKNLPTTQADRGRASKKAAYGLLAKAALQRTRLGETVKYAKIALDAAEELISNQGEYDCALYLSDATKSGYAKLWDGENNKSNSEFLFLQAIDYEGALNPEGWNRGRTRQYYQTDTRTVGSPWGTIEKSLIYGRANSRSYKPTKYLLTTVFEPSENTPDTRFENTFFYKYYAINAATISAEMASQFNKDASLIGHTILSSAGLGSENDVKAANFYAGIGWKDNNKFEGFKNIENDESLSIFTPNWIIPEQEKSLMPCLVNDPSDMFGSDGKYVEDISRKDIYPSLKKFSSVKYAYTEQYHMGDIPMLRLGDIYLVAAEAALLYDNNKAKAADYVNQIRKRAALTTRESEIVVDASTVTVDFILEERARELAGEQLRWYDLKRTGKLTNSYLTEKNPVAFQFDDAKHTKRPIPLKFLNSISNAEEFGTNGY